MLLAVAAAKRVAHSGTCAIPQGAGILGYFPGLWNINPMCLICAHKIPDLLPLVFSPPTIPPLLAQSPRAPSTHHIHAPHQMALLRRQDVSTTWIDDQSQTLLSKYLGNWTRYYLDQDYNDGTYTSTPNAGASLSFAFTGK